MTDQFKIDKSAWLFDAYNNTAAGYCSVNFRAHGVCHPAIVMLFPNVPGHDMRFNKNAVVRQLTLLVNAGLTFEELEASVLEAVVNKRMAATKTEARKS